MVVWEKEIDEMCLIPRVDPSRTEKQKDVWKLQKMQTAITSLLFSSAVVRAGRYKTSSNPTQILSSRSQKTLLYKNCSDISDIK